MKPEIIKTETGEFKQFTATEGKVLVETALYKELGEMPTLEQIQGIGFRRGIATKATTPDDYYTEILLPLEYGR